MTEPDKTNLNREDVLRTLNYLNPEHDFGSGTLQWMLMKAYVKEYPERGYTKLFEREKIRSEQVLREIAAETLFGTNWQTEPSKITENLVLNTRYSEAASLENFSAVTAEIRRRRHLDPDFERRRKNAEHRSQERVEPVKANRLAIVMAQNWVNPSAPFWMASVEGGAAYVSNCLKENILPSKFKTTRDRLRLRSFPKSPFEVPRVKNFEIRPVKLRKEGERLVLALQDDAEFISSLETVGGDISLDKSSLIHTPGF